ncbi:PadR family transcriptional regulator [Streptomyces sp. NPDC000941]
MSIGHTPLGLLESGPRHGYDLKRAFDETFGHDRPLHYDQVYSTMSRLLKEQWLATPQKPEAYLQSALYTKCDHALFHLEADLRRPELTAARLDKLREAVAR